MEEKDQLSLGTWNLCWRCSGGSVWRIIGYASLEVRKTPRLEMYIYSHQGHMERKAALAVSFDIASHWNEAG